MVEFWWELTPLGTHSSLVGGRGTPSCTSVKDYSKYGTNSRLLNYQYRSASVVYCTFRCPPSTAHKCEPERPNFAFSCTPAYFTPH